MKRKARATPLRKAAKAPVGRRTAKSQKTRKKLAVRLRKQAVSPDKPGKGPQPEIPTRKLAEAALHESESRFHLVMDHANDAIVYLDLNGMIQWASLQTTVLTGRPMTDLVGNPVMSALTPEAAVAAEARLAAVRRGEAIPPLVEFEILRPDGQLVVAEANITSVRRTEGVVGRLLVLRDITERKKAENALKENAIHHRAILDSAMDAVITITQRGRIVEFNPAAEVIFGYARGAVIGKEMVELIIPPSLREKHRMGMARYLATGVASIMGKRIEITALHADGTEFPVELTVTRIVLAGQTFFTAFIRDITAHKRAEGALRESQELFHGAFDNAAIGMALVAPDGRWLQVNRALREIVGYSEQELLATNFQAITHPDDLEADLNLARQVLDGEICTYQMEKRYIHKLGNVVWILLNVSLVRDLQENPLYFIGQIQDITARKRAEEERRELYERLRASHDGLRRLSHRLIEVQEEERHHIAREMHDEIGQALTAAKINVQQALHAPTSPETGTHLAESSRILDHVLQQVRNLALDLRPSLLDDLGLIPTLTWLAERHSQASKIAVQVSAEPLGIRPAPEIELACYRIAQEALTNAARHAGASQVRIELTRSGRELVLLIRDNGIGFDMTTMLSRAARGKSIGLLGMQERATLTGGQLEVFSSAGQGTEIRARFPLNAPGPFRDTRA